MRLRTSIRTKERNSAAAASNPLAESRRLFGRGRGEQMQPASDDAGPPGLVAGAQASTVVTGEVFVEQQAITPVVVLLELFRPAVDGPPAIPVLEEDTVKPAGDLL